MTGRGCAQHVNVSAGSCSPPEMFPQSFLGLSVRFCPQDNPTCH